MVFKHLHYNIKIPCFLNAKMSLALFFKKYLNKLQESQVLNDLKKAFALNGKLCSYENFYSKSFRKLACRMISIHCTFISNIRESFRQQNTAVNKSNI